jgi:subtilase family serine protease
MKNRISANRAGQPPLRAIIGLTGAVVFLFAITSALAADRHVLHSRVHAVVTTLTPLGRLPATDRLKLVIGLPLRNQAEFDLLLQQLYDPASPNFHHYLTPDQLRARFGPTEADYQAVINFAKANGLQVAGTYDNRLMVDVFATVSDIEKAFQVTLRTYQHPAESRHFYAPDVEASVDASLPILDVSGLDNYVGRHPMGHKMPATRSKGDAGGTGPSGLYMGRDFRNAYASNVTVTGAGQYVGLVEREGYYASDITNYEKKAGLPYVPLTNIFMDGLNSENFIDTSDTNGIAECSVDIELPISMAPGMTGLYVFEGTNTDHLLGAMITNTQIKQFSTSWALNPDDTAEQDFQIMQAQGQSFFTFSGDGDAWVVPIYFPGDDTNVTVAGGTDLTMKGSGASYASETVWNDGSHGVSNGWWGNPNSVSNTYWGSGGGVSTTYSIPPWQQSVNVTAVGGSSSMRNTPDVALTAVNVYNLFDNGINWSYEGTSCAAPLWAGFTALVNEQAANQGLPSVGFLNPALYAIGQSPLYNSAFHDITNGNNIWPGSSGEYNAAPGYDLCTGWGTPNGQAMIDALVGYAGPIWVNFSGPCPGNGTYTNAFCALESGTSAVATGGTVCLVGPNSSSVTPTITKAMTLRAFYGPVTIGKQ